MDRKRSLPCCYLLLNYLFIYFIGPSFKRSSVKTDESLEFIPVNLHLQRMWAQNDTLNRTGVLDINTVGAFTRHAGKGRTGGLIK